MKLGNDKYEYLAQTFNLPVSRTLNNYSCPDTNAPDGLLTESLAMTRKKFDNKFPDADEMAWSRYGILGWDSMTVK